MSKSTSRRATAPAASTTAGPLTARFKLAKETKGAVRYAEVDQFGNKLVDDADGALVGFVYFRKAAMSKWLGSDEVPQVLEISVGVPT